MRQVLHAHTAQQQYNNSGRQLGMEHVTKIREVRTQKAKVALYRNAGNGGSVTAPKKLEIEMPRRNEIHQWRGASGLSSECGQSKVSIIVRQVTIGVKEVDA